MNCATKIIGVGKYIPEREISNDYVLELLRRKSGPYLTSDELDQVMGKAGRSLEKAGNEIRYWCREDQYCTDIARLASLEALEDAGIGADDIDLIIFTGMSKALVEPATAHILQAELGASRANVIDTQDACASFLKSIQIADSLIRTGAYRTILIACGERTYDWAHFQCKTPEELDWNFGSLTIGDAAGAMILQATEEATYRDAKSHMLFKFISDGRGHPYCNIGLNFRIGERYKLQSHSKKLINSIMQLFAGGAQGLAEDRRKDITYDILVVHEIGRIIPEVMMPIMEQAGIGLPNYRFLYPEYGNIASASLPVGMSVAKEDGRLQRGHQVAFAGGAAGTSFYGGTFVY